MFKPLCLLLLLCSAPGAFGAAASAGDYDGDGAPDEFDSWPTNPAAAIDQDHDGAPDAWVPGCDKNCQVASGLMLDAFPTEFNLAVDENKNGIPDAFAIFCDALCEEALIAKGITRDIPDLDRDGSLDNSDTDDNNDGAVDADSDSNGLIDIYTLKQLDAIRFDLHGASRKLSVLDPGDSSGCPLVYTADAKLVPRCHGYELKNNVDFDTNKNGTLDAGDEYWNGGRGWIPIGNYNANFNGVFEGNGFALEHFYIAYPGARAGLFFGIEDAYMRNLAMVDFNMQAEEGGPLAGRILGGVIEGVYMRGEFSCSGASSRLVGGLVGESYYDVSIANALIATDISCPNGSAFGLGTWNADLSVSGKSRAILVLGRLNTLPNEYQDNFAFANAGQVSQSYWPYDLTQQNTAGVTGATGATLAQLKCPDAANNTSCIPGVTLYEHWDQEKNAAGQDYWVFAASNQLPALKLNGSVYSYQPQVTANQAPQVRIQFDKNATTAGADGRNYFSLRAVITDPDSLNVHALKWDYGALRPSNTLENGYEFFRPAPGKYTVKLRVTDSGLPALAATTEMILEFKEDLTIASDPVKPVTEPVKPNTDAQAGAVDLNSLILILGLACLRRARKGAGN